MVQKTTLSFISGLVAQESHSEAEEILSFAALKGPNGCQPEGLGRSPTSLVQGTLLPAMLIFPT